MPENIDHNLWRGSEYVRERGVLICLHSTYEYTTQECIQHFHDRDPEWFDYTFGIVIDWVICQKGQSREQAMAPLAITNFYEKVLRHIGQAPSGFKPSQAAFRRRLALLQPKVVLLACEDKYVLEDVQQATSEAKPGIFLVPTIHPAKRADIYERVKLLQAAWAEVQRHLTR